MHCMPSFWLNTCLFSIILFFISYYMIIVCELDIDVEKLMLAWIVNQ